jgi:hypothetical protein
MGSEACGMGEIRQRCIDGLINKYVARVSEDQRRANRSHATMHAECERHWLVEQQIIARQREAVATMRRPLQMPLLLQAI